MADKAVTVAVNVVPGQDAMTPALQQQAAAAAALQKQLDATRAAAGAAPTGLIPPEQVRVMPRMVPPEQIRVLPGTPPPPPDPGSPAELMSRQMAGQTRNIVTSQLLAYTQASQGPGQENRLAGVAGVVGAFAALPGPLGMAASAASILTSTVGNLAASFRQINPTLQETMGVLNRANQNLAQVRSTGIASAETLRTAFADRPAVIAELTAAQRGGNAARQRQILEREREQAQQESAQFANANPEGEQSFVETLLRNRMQQFRTTNAGTRQLMRDRFQRGGPAGTGIDAQAIENAWLRAGNRLEDMPEELRNINPANLTPELVQQLSQQIGGRAIGARARLEAAGAALGPGGIANLRPGAVQLSDLQTLTAPRQGDVLDLHAQIQQEAFRDVREEARFQAMFNLVERFMQQQADQSNMLSPLPAWMRGFFGPG